MSVSPFILSGMDPQSGAPQWFDRWDKGTTTLPEPGTSGTNRPANKTNGRITSQFICLREKSKDLQSAYKNQFERFLFRVMDKDDNQRAAIDFYQQQLNSALNLPSQENSYLSNKLYARANDRMKLDVYPACHMFTYQQLNYVLAYTAFVQKTTLTSLFLEKNIRPLGINLTPSATAQLAQNVDGEVRVLITNGPQRMPNEFGSSVKENDTVYAVFTPLSTTVPASSISFRLGESKQEVARVPTGLDGKAPYYWSVTMVSGDVAPNAPVLIMPDGQEIYGYSLRLGKVQFVYQEENKTLNAFFGPNKSVYSNPQAVAKENDSYAADLYPQVSIMVDLFDTTAER